MKMFRVLTAVVFTACTLVPLAAHAADKNVATEKSAKTVAPVKGQMVHVKLKNRGTQTQNLVVDGKAITLATEQEYALAAPEGTQVMGADNTVKATIAKNMEGATVAFR